MARVFRVGEAPSLDRFGPRLKTVIVYLVPAIDDDRSEFLMKLIHPSAGETIANWNASERDRFVKPACATKKLRWCSMQDTNATRT